MSTSKISCHTITEIRRELKKKKKYHDLKLKDSLRIIIATCDKKSVRPIWRKAFIEDCPSAAKCYVVRGKKKENRWTMLGQEENREEREWVGSGWSGDEELTCIYISVPTTNRLASMRGGIGMGKTDKDLGWHPVGSWRHDEDKWHNIADSDRPIIAVETKSS